VVLAFMLLVLGILVGGSLWIMNNLNYNMVMTPSQIAQDEGVQQ
jgi:heme/copper-type cytochrome/quinol oxidase subunit 4